MLVKIGDVAAQYEISNRTLRYWEEAGILTSIRKDNGYRYYDTENIKRIKQIMMLRKLRVPIQDIQGIFVSNELSMVVEVLQNHLADTANEMKQLWNWAENNEKYEVDWNPEIDRRWLEECIDYFHFNSPDTSENDKQLDLLMPIKLKKQ